MFNNSIICNFTDDELLRMLEESDNDDSSDENSDDSEEEIGENTDDKVSNSDSPTPANTQVDPAAVDPNVLAPSNALPVPPPFDWEKHPCLRQKYPKPFPFTGNSGIQVDVINKSALDIFELFFSPDLMKLIVDQTNLYAQQCRAKVGVPKRYSRLNAWKDCVVDEIFRLIAIYIMQGLVIKPTLASYYEKNKLLETPGFVKMMSLNRLCLLNKYLHFANNAELPQNKNEKKLYKIRPVLEHLSAKFQEIYIPEENVAIDESLLLWKGRLSFKQFIRIKRARFGIKSYILSESSTGYVYKLVVYLGKGTILSENRFGHATNVVLSLLEGMFDQGYTVYTDNFYCSPELAQQLMLRRTDLVGTVRPNRRNLPQGTARLKLKPDEMVAWYSNRKICIGKWRDKREIIFLSTIHRLGGTEVRRRGSSKVIPTAIDAYNNHMGGVDKVDQMLSAYPLERKRGKVWYKKQFRHIVNITIQNALIIYQKAVDPSITNLEFRKMLVNEIFLRYVPTESPRKRGRPSYTEDPCRMIERHFLNSVPEKKSRRCVVCNSKKKRKDTRYECRDCDVGLCVVPCMEIYHTQKHYDKNLPSN